VRRGKSTTATATLPYGAFHLPYTAPIADNGCSQLRPNPSPAFNQESEVHPLQNAQTPEMDDS
jgi:hypothetical protein